MALNKRRITYPLLLYAALCALCESTNKNTKKKHWAREMKIRRGKQMPFQVQFERCRYAKCTLSKHTHTQNSLSSWMCRLISQTINLIYCPNIKKSRNEKSLCSLYSFHLAWRFRVHSSVRSIAVVDAIFFNPLTLMLLPESWKLIEMDSLERSWVR